MMVTWRKYNERSKVDIEIATMDIIAIQVN